MGKAQRRVSAQNKYLRCININTTNTIITVFFKVDMPLCLGVQRGILVHTLKNRLPKFTGVVSVSLRKSISGSIKSLVFSVIGFWLSHLSSSGSAS